MYDLVNWLAIVVASVAAMAVGAVWYSSLLFGKKWMKLVGKSQADLKKANTMQSYLMAFVMALISAFVLWRFMDMMGATNYVQGAMAGFWSGVGLVATGVALNYMFEGRPQQLIWLTVGHHVVALTLMGAVLGLLG